jgi:hypothetical protein
MARDECPGGAGIIWQQIFCNYSVVIWASANKYSPKQSGMWLILENPGNIWASKPILEVRSDTGNSLLLETR